jgi:hypothetical protein
VRSVAVEQRVALIDMHRKSELVVKQYGPDGSRKLFLQLKPGEDANYPQGVENNTHFSPLGAEIMARLSCRRHKGATTGTGKVLEKDGRRK